MSKKKYEPVDLRKTMTFPIRQRKNKVSVKSFGSPCSLHTPFTRFLESLPHTMAGDDFREVVDSIVGAHRRGCPVIFAMGAHIVKCGLSPIIIALMKQGVITCVAMNGAGSIHDFEIALIGETSEDVGEGLKAGTFGMARETGELMNGAIKEGVSQGLGMGEALGRKILDLDLPYREYSILAAAAERSIPLCVFVGMGTDIIHMHGSMDGRATGEGSLIDFRLFTSVVSELGNGGVYLNVGSAVILPEVFLKALTIAKNQGARFENFATVNIDMWQHYRPLQNVVNRPAVIGGKGYTITGHHEIMIPLLALAITEKLAEQHGQIL